MKKHGYEKEIHCKIAGHATLDSLFDASLAAVNNLLVIYFCKGRLDGAACGERPRPLGVRAAAAGERGGGQRAARRPGQVGQHGAAPRRQEEAHPGGSVRRLAPKRRGKYKLMIGDKA